MGVGSLKHPKGCGKPSQVLLCISTFATQMRKENEGMNQRMKFLLFTFSCCFHRRIAVGGFCSAEFLQLAFRNTLCCHCHSQGFLLNRCWLGQHGAWARWGGGGLGPSLSSCKLNFTGARGGVLGAEIDHLVPHGPSEPP